MFISDGKAHLAKTQMPKSIYAQMKLLVEVRMLLVLTSMKVHVGWTKGLCRYIWSFKVGKENKSSDPTMLFRLVQARRRN